MILWFISRFRLRAEASREGHMTHSNKTGALSLARFYGAQKSARWSPPPPPSITASVSGRLPYAMLSHTHVQVATADAPALCQTPRRRGPLLCMQVVCSPDIDLECCTQRCCNRVGRLQPGARHGKLTTTRQRHIHIVIPRLLLPASGRAALLPLRRRQGGHGCLAGVPDRQERSRGGGTLRALDAVPVAEAASEPAAAAAAVVAVARAAAACGRP